MPRGRKRRAPQRLEREEQQAEGGAGNVVADKVIDFEEIMRASNIFQELPVNVAEPVSRVEASTTCSSKNGGGDSSFGAGLNRTRCLSDEVFAHVPLSIREKIWAGGFINLAILLKGTCELDEFCSGGSLCVTSEGTIESRPKECKNKVPNIEKWTDAFIIFMAIYITAHTEEASDLLKYMFNIREAAFKQGGFAWRAYDEQFRLRQEFSKSSWAVINTDLWWRCSLGNACTSSAVASNNAAQAIRTNLSRPLPCLDYNKGNCRWTNCRFVHICSYCNGSHPQCNCFKKPKEGLARDMNGNRANFRTQQSRVRSQFGNQGPSNSTSK